jgi:small subunit ribosomal protein S17
MERNTRKVHIGKVVSDKADKTIKVAITTYRRHPLYGKRLKFTRKLTAHDENNEARVGDIVKVMETRPLSKTKHYRLLEILGHANNA